MARRDLERRNESIERPPPRLDVFIGDSGSGGEQGLVPAPAAGDATKFLKGDGNWATVSGSGTGDVVGPASSVTGNFAVFADTTGKEIADGGTPGDGATADFGSSAGTICEGNDARLSDARTPTAHASSHVTSGTDKIRDATASQDGLMTAAYAAKLDGIASGANAGITQLTGDVTAGPGSGSQAATIANDTVTNAKAADMAAWTIKVRNNAASGDPQDVVATDLTEETTPAAGDFLLGWESGGALRKFDVGDLPGSGGSSAPTFQRKTLASDFTVTANTALQSVTGMSAAVEANKEYKFEFRGEVTTTGSGEGYRVALQLPAGATMQVDVLAQTGASVITPGLLNASDVENVVTAAIGANARRLLMIGRITTAGTAGNVVLRFASETTGTVTSTLEAGAEMELMERTLLP